MQSHPATVSSVIAHFDRQPGSCMVSSAVYSQIVSFHERTVISRGPYDTVTYKETKRLTVLANRIDPFD